MVSSSYWNGNIWDLLRVCLPNNKQIEMQDHFCESTFIRQLRNIFLCNFKGFVWQMPHTKNSDIFDKQLCHWAEKIMERAMNSISLSKLCLCFSETFAYIWICIVLISGSNSPGNRYCSILTYQAFLIKCLLVHTLDDNWMMMIGDNEGSLADHRARDSRKG